MAFNLDHTASGDLTLVGSHIGFTGIFNVPPVFNTSEDAVFLIQNSPISAISGLENELSLKENTGNIKSASSFDCGNSAGQIPIIESTNYLNENIFPKITQTTMFVATNSGNLISLNNAVKGDMATITSPSGCTFVLCSSEYNNINHWIPLRHPGNCINTVNNLTGNVVLDSNNVLLDVSTEFVTGSNLSYYLQNLNTGKIVLSSLEQDYMEIFGENNFEDTISCYAEKTCVTSSLSVILTTGDLQNCTNNYATTCCFNDELVTGYVLKTQTGNVSYLKDVGTQTGNIVEVENTSFISHSVLPTIALSTAYSISSSGDLTGLSNASIGDIAVDSVNLKNYILADSGNNAYSNIDNWKQFTNNIGTVRYVNGQAADAQRNVLIDSSHVQFSGEASGYTISCKIKDSDDLTNYLQSTLQDCTQFTGDVCTNYVLNNTFNTILTTKSTTGHQHVINDVDELGGCLDSIHAFKKGDLINLDPSDSYKLHPDSANTQFAALMLGVESKASVFGEIVIGAGKFTEVGDAQVSEIIFKGSTSVDSWQSLSNEDSSNIPMESNSAVLVYADVVGKGVSNTGIYASFRLEGALAKENSNVSTIEDFEKTVVSRSSGVYDARITTSANSFNVQVLGHDGENMHWVSKINLVKVKGEQFSGNAPETGSYLTGTYFYAGTGNSWYDLNNWWTNASHTIAANTLPSGTTDVEMLSLAYVDLDNGFVTPNSIDTTAVSGDLGICLYSNQGASFNGTIYGNATLFGSAILN